MDLGVENPIERVPILQKMIIASCNRSAVPVITATEMLEPMVADPSPTGAEVSDIANAIFDGTDAMMLSEETATGKYPVECVSSPQGFDHRGGEDVPESTSTGYP